MKHLLLIIALFSSVWAQSQNLTDDELRNSIIKSLRANKIELQKEKEILENLKKELNNESNIYEDKLTQRKVFRISMLTLLPLNVVVSASFHGMAEKLDKTNPTKAKKVMRASMISGIVGSSLILGTFISYTLLKDLNPEDHDIEFSIKKGQELRQKIREYILTIKSKEAMIEMQIKMLENLESEN